MLHILGLMVEVSCDGFSLAILCYIFRRFPLYVAAFGSELLRMRNRKHDLGDN